MKKKDHWIRKIATFGNFEKNQDFCEKPIFLRKNNKLSKVLKKPTISVAF